MRAPTRGTPRLPPARCGYDRGARRENIYGRYRARSDGARGEGRRMTAVARSTRDDGKPVLTRARFSEIKPNSFRWQQDRSYDDGRTWDEATLTITAKRVAANAPR